MSVADELQERERQAGNAEDSYDPSQQYYNRQFNDIAKNDEDRDFDQIIADNYGDGAASEKTDTHGDTIQRNYNADEPGDSRADTEEREKNPSQPPSSGRGSSRVSRMLMNLGVNTKKYGASAGLVGMLLFGIVAIDGGMVSLAGSLLINIKEIFHNDRSDGTRTNRLFARATIANMYKGEEDCKGSKIKCKASTMSKNMIKNLKEQGFRVKGKIFDANGKDTGKTLNSDSEDFDNQDKTPTDNNSPGSGSGMADTDQVAVSEVKVPDNVGGGTAKDGKTLFKLVDSSPEGLRLFNRAFNTRSAYYLNSFFSKVLQSKFGFSKGAKKFPNDDDPSKSKDDIKKAQDEEFNQESGGMSDEDKAGDPLKSKAKEVEDNAHKESGIDKASDKAGKAGAAAAVLQTTCSAYKLTRGAITAVKLYQIAQLGKFALVFFQAADEIKDGKGDQSRVRYLSDNVMYSDPNPKNSDGSVNEKYGLAGPDAQGYKIAALGDTSALTDFAKNYVLGGSGTITSKINGVLKKIESPIGQVTNAVGVTNKTSNAAGGREALKEACRLINNPAVGTAASCASAIGGLTALSAAVSEGVGAPVGAVAGAVACGCQVVTVSQAGALSGAPKSVSDIVGKALDTIDPCVYAEKAISWLASKAFKGILAVAGPWIEDILREVSVGSDTKGVDAVNAIAAGAGLMLSTTSAGYGLKPSSATDKNKEVTDYIAYTQPLEDQYIALEKDDARSNPLDASNQYSLLGSVVRSFDPQSMAGLQSTSMWANVATLANIFPSALKVATTGESASALYNQPSTAANGASGRYDECSDDDLAYINATGDKFCSIVAISTISELQKATDQIDGKANNWGELVDYMRNTDKQTEDKTKDPDNCALLDGNDDRDGCPTSKLESIDDEGAPIKDSQYSKYLQYCTDQRHDPWGAQAEPYEQGSDRDQRWYSGQECMLSVDDKNSYESVKATKTEAQMVSNFRMWTNICQQIGTMRGADSCYGTTTQTVAQANGNACNLLDNPNIVMRPETIEGVKELCETGHATNLCGQDFKLNPILINNIVSLSSKYKVWINNFGFKTDRNNPGDCAGNTWQHPKGNAVDLNGIQILNGGGQAGGEGAWWGGINYSSDQIPVLNAYASDWLAGLPPSRGGIGQKGCGGGSDNNLAFNPTFPANATSVNGAAFFDDSCDHLHLDVRDRSDLSAV